LAKNGQFASYKEKLEKRTAGVINYQEKMFKKKKKNEKKKRRAGCPWDVKGHKGVPWWQKGALLKMPSRSTTTYRDLRITGF
jgi:hypothetical protein